MSEACTSYFFKVFFLCWFPSQPYFFFYSMCNLNLTFSLWCPLISLFLFDVYSFFFFFVVDSSSKELTNVELVYVLDNIRIDFSCFFLRRSFSFTSLISLSSEELWQLLLLSVGLWLENQPEGTVVVVADLWFQKELVVF